MNDDTLSIDQLNKIRLQGMVTEQPIFNSTYLPFAIAFCGLLITPYIVKKIRNRKKKKAKK